MGEPTVSRTNIPFILDTVTIRTPEAITKALATGDLVRLNDATTPETLPILLRWYFPVSRFLSPPHGFFLPMRSSEDPTFAPCRKFLDDAFTAPSTTPITEHVKKAADLLSTDNPSEKDLSATFARAISCRFLPHGLPQNIVNDADKQIEFGESFLPWKYIPAKSAMKRIFAFFDTALRATGALPELPNTLVTDVAHSSLATMLHGAAVLQEIGKNPGEDVDAILARLGRVESVPRMVKQESTLGGQLKKVAKPGWTVVFLDIRSSARDTGDVSWAFGTGTTERRCAAEPAIREFFKAVQTELLARRGN